MSTINLTKNNNVNVNHDNNEWNVQALEYNQGLSLVHIVSIMRRMKSKMELHGRFLNGVFRGNFLIRP